MIKPDRRTNSLATDVIAESVPDLAALLCEK
jgi:hypothetical protein